MNQNSGDRDADGEVAVGKAGDINIQTGSLSLSDGAGLATSTNGLGDAGSVFIRASGPVSFTSGSNIGTSVAVREAVGNGGDITILAQSLSLDDAFLSTSTRGQGNAGSVFVQTNDSVSLTNNSFISSSVEDSEAVGNGGDITILAQSLSLDDASLSTDTFFGQGNAGSVFVQTNDSVSLTNTSFILSDVAPEAVGKGGDINITARSLSLREGALLGTLTVGRAGNAGRADAGNIRVNVSDSVSVSGGFLISGTYGEGDAGNVTIEGRDGVLPVVSFDGVGSGVSSTVGRDLELGVGSGKGGDITIRARSLSLTNGALLNATTTGQGNAGNIFVNVRDTLQANDGTISTAAAQFAGGKIDITAGNIFLSGDSDIRTDVANGPENGGNINLTADSVIAFNDSDILAFAEDGRGGDITLKTPAFLGAGYVSAPAGTDPDSLDGNNRVDVNASGAVAAGNITIPDTTFLQNSFTDLLENPIDINTLVANSCVTRSDRQKGSFVITGADGFQHRPGDAFISPYPTGTVRPIPDDTTSSNPPSSVSNLRPTRPWQIGDQIVEAQGVYRLADGQLVLSRECPN